MDTRFFRGRDKEVSELLDAWALAREGKPQLRTVVGDKGVGKTAIVQAFYTKLAEDGKENPGGYWPTRMGEGDTARVNPNPNLVNTQADIPFLWWGMGFTEGPPPDQEDLRPSPFQHEDASLMIHTAPIERRRKLKASRTSAFKTIASYFTDLFAGGAISAGSAAATLLSSILNSSKLESEARESAAQQILANADRINQRVITALRCFMDDGNSSAPTIPVVLFLDDAQWCDAATALSLDAILDEAQSKNKNKKKNKKKNKQGWHLLIVATHEKADWRSGSAIQSRGVTDASDYSLLHSHRADGVATDAQVIDVDPLPEADIRSVLGLRLPGVDLDRTVSSGVIGKSYAEHLLRIVDGRPSVISDLICSLNRKRTEAFVDGDPACDLTAKGYNYLQAFDAPDLTNLMRIRYESLDPRLKDILECGALMGRTFSADIVQQALLNSCPADQAWKDNERTSELLDEAEHTYSLVLRSSQNVVQFRSSTIFSLVCDNCRLHENLAQRRGHELITLILELLKNGSIYKYSARERLSLLGMLYMAYLDHPQANEHLQEDAGKAFSLVMDGQYHSGRHHFVIGYWALVAEQAQRLGLGFFKAACHALHTISALSNYANARETVSLVLMQRFEAALAAEPSSVEYGRYYPAILLELAQVELIKNGPNLNVRRWITSAREQIYAASIATNNSPISLVQLGDLLVMLIRLLDMLPEANSETTESGQTRAEKEKNIAESLTQLGAVGAKLLLKRQSPAHTLKAARYLREYATLALDGAKNKKLAKEQYDKAIAALESLASHQISLDTRIYLAQLKIEREEIDLPQNEEEFLNGGGNANTQLLGSLVNEIEGHLKSYYPTPKLLLLSCQARLSLEKSRLDLSNPLPFMEAWSYSVNVRRKVIEEYGFNYQRFTEYLQAISGYLGLYAKDPALAHEYIHNHRDADYRFNHVKEFKTPFFVKRSQQVLKDFNAENISFEERLHLAYASASIATLCYQTMVFEGAKEFADRAKWIINVLRNRDICPGLGFVIEQQADTVLVKRLEFLRRAR